MERPLVVTDQSAAVVDLIQEAGSLAAAVNAPLLVLTVVTESEYENDAEVLGEIERVERSNYNLEPEAYAEQIAETAIDDLLSDLDLEAEAIGRYVDTSGDRANAILQVAAANDCDYIFLLGSRRSPTGKAMFGDMTQSVILNFDGYVVTITE